VKYTTQVDRTPYAETTAADGRDLSREEFRTIPGFEKYEITRDGDVRNIRTGRLLAEIENKKTGLFSYCLWKDDGKNTHRSWERLVWLAYPEIEAKAKAEKAAEAAKPYKVRTHRVTECRYGHEYTPENTRVTKNGGRDCKKCHKYRSRIRRQKLKEAKELAAV